MRTGWRRRRRRCAASAGAVFKCIYDASLVPGWRRRVQLLLRLIAHGQLCFCWIAGLGRRRTRCAASAAVVVFLYVCMSLTLASCLELPASAAPPHRRFLPGPTHLTLPCSRSRSGARRSTQQWLYKHPTSRLTCGVLLHFPLVLICRRRSGARRSSRPSAPPSASCWSDPSELNSILDAASPFAGCCIVEAELTGRGRCNRLQSRELRGRSTLLADPILRTHRLHMRTLHRSAALPILTSWLCVPVQVHQV